ncbi:MAG: hypothetical protein Kow0068_03330 [Marinilabiliales bacterium]
MIKTYIPDKKIIKSYNKTRGKIKKNRICYAPFSSMLFIQSGQVMPCHYNRGTVLGKISENTIHEIWFGNKLKNLQEHIAKNDFSSGCESCYYNIINQQFYNAGCKKYDNLFSFGKYPIMMDFQISNTCNLECIMCSGEYSSTIRKNREKQDNYPDYYKNDFVNQLDEFIPYLQYAKFTGGEPFLINNYYKIWDKIATQKPDINISVSTNGSILNDKIKYLLEKLKFQFTVSIDSINENTYPQIRKNSDLQNVLNNIKYFHDYSIKKHTSLIIKFVVIQQNMYEIPEFVEYWNNKNIRILPKMVWFPPYASLRNIDSEKLKELIVLYKNKKLSASTRIQKQNNQYYKGIISQLEKWVIEKQSIIDNNKSTEEIKKELIKNIQDFLLTKTDNSEVQSLMEKYSKTIDFLCNSIADEKEMRKSLIIFSELPVHLVVAEINRENPQKLLSKFVQASYF